MKIATVIGTRPGIIKMSPLIGECKKWSKDFFILYTGQYYSHNMDGIFFRHLESARKIGEIEKKWDGPFGDGRAGETIIGISERRV